MVSQAFVEHIPVCETSVCKILMTYWQLPPIQTLFHNKVASGNWHWNHK